MKLLFLVITVTVLFVGSVSAFHLHRVPLTKSELTSNYLLSTKLNNYVQQVTGGRDKVRLTTYKGFFFFLKCIS